MKSKVIKGLILVGFLLVGMSVGFNSKKEEGNSRVPSAAVDFKLHHMTNYMVDLRMLK